MKRKIRLTEGDLHRIVKESVKKVLKEDDNYVPISTTFDDDDKTRTDTYGYNDNLRDSYPFDEDLIKKYYCPVNIESSDKN